MKQVLHRGLVGIATSMTMSSFGLSLISVFIPLLLLRHGLLLWQVCAFYAAYAICKLLLNFPAMLLLNRRGVRLGLTVGYVARAAYLGTLSIYLANHHAWTLLLLPVLLAIDNAFVWGAEHLYISRAMDVQRTGRDLASINALGQIGGVIAPLAGSAIAVWLGQAWLAGVAAACVMVAAIPVSRYAPGKMIATKTLHYSLKYAPPRDLIANFGFNLSVAVGTIVWPFYLAVVLPNFHSIGLITTISAAIAFTLLFAAGRRGDKGKNRAVLKEGSALTSLSHVARLLAATPFGFTIVSALYATALSYQNIPWSSLYYRHARENGINYIMSMEIMCDLANVLLWSALGTVAYLTSSHSHALFIAAFCIAAVFSWACTLMTGDSHLLTKSSPGLPTSSLQ
ncbi:MAG TPA: MFS transporter [Patescibacteria group bacterium]|nr:MFS transporter [Patescibacteria group bacterium]